LLLYRPVDARLWVGFCPPSLHRVMLAVLVRLQFLQEARNFIEEG